MAKAPTKKSAPTKKATRKKAAPKNGKSGGSVSTKGASSIETPTKKTTEKVTKKTTRKKAETKTTPPPEREILYPELSVRVFSQEDSPITETLAKEILGWREESENISFGDDYLFKMPISGKKVRCLTNLHNRDFAITLARDWMLEILKRNWKLNGETIIVDEKGEVQSGQHRLIAVPMAVEEWKAHPSRWKEYWGDTEPFMESLVVFGVDSSDDTINTIDVGKPRSLADVIFRSPYFADTPRKQRKTVATVCSYTMKTIWQRTGYDQNAFLARRPHSESVEFLNLHPTILECVKHVVAEKESLQPLLPLGYSSSMQYLMAAGRTEPKEYDGTEQTLDLTLLDQAQDFWIYVSQGVDEIKPLIETLKELDLTGSYYRDEVCALVAKAWLAYLEDGKVTKDSLALDHEEDELGRLVLTESPTVGGIDAGGVTLGGDEE